MGLGFGNLALTVNQPMWLLLLVLALPPVVLLSLKSLAGLGRFRQTLAILFRTIVVTLLILALAELQTVRTHDRLTTLFLLDLSQSIPREWLEPMRTYVNEAIRVQKKSDDHVGALIFGKTPRIEMPPTVLNEARLLGFETIIDPEYTDLAGALKLALATFPEDTARRIVLVSDGNQNRGNVLEQAAAARKLGVQVDVAPIEYQYNQEVLVEKISLPPDVKKGETVNINVVVRASEPTNGTLQIFQKTADGQRAAAPGNEQPLPIDLERGINVYTLKQTIQEPSFYTFTAEFIPGVDSGDKRRINNVAEGFTHARGTAQVLVIEGTRGEHADLVKTLRDKGIEVTLLLAPRIDGSGAVGGDQIPNSLADLQPYDAVILANVPKESFTDSQQKMLEANVHDMGAGLIMLGGPESFGAGGWMNSPVEKALPVDMQIKALRVQGKSAMVLIMHASEIPEGNYWQKVVAQEALKTLSSYDYAGMLHWQGQEAWLFTLKEIGPNRNSMLRAIDRMTPGDMPDFDPSLQLALDGLRRRTDAMTKHIVIISDGDPTAPTSSIIRALVNNKVTVTSVLTAAHGNDRGAMNVMQRLAQQTKGRFYNVTNPKALPRIYQKEARTISRPLIYEEGTPWAPNLASPTEPVTGLPSPLPPIKGLVLTSPKESELVEIPIVSPRPNGQVNPLLAHWTYGLGRAAAFTSDAGARWTSAWQTWESYAAFWTQLVRWSLRPVDRGNLTMSLRRENGRIKIVVDALDKNQQFLNFLRIAGTVVDPEMNRKTVELTQTAPGRYEAVVENAETSGNYFVNLAHRDQAGNVGLVSSGVSVPYSDEYRELRSNPSTLENIASLTGGKVIDWKRRPSGELDLAGMLDSTDLFRRDPAMAPPKTFRGLWPELLWLAAVFFLGDVAVRRLAPDVQRIRRSLAQGIDRLRGRVAAPESEYMEKLKSRKAEVGEQLERSRGATRFEPGPLPPPVTRPSQPVDLPRPTSEGGDSPTRSTSEAGTSPPASRPGMASPNPSSPPPTQESYTSRLLKAKQKVWEEREKDKEGGDGASSSSSR